MMLCIVFGTAGALDLRHTTFTPADSRLSEPVHTAAKSNAVAPHTSDLVIVSATVSGSASQFQGSAHRAARTPRKNSSELIQ